MVRTVWSAVKPSSSGGSAARRWIQKVSSPAEAAPATSQQFEDTKPTSAGRTSQMLGRQVVDARARLEDLHLLDTQDGVEEIGDPGAPDRRLQHVRRAVGQDGQAETASLEGLEARLHVGERGQGQVGLQQARAPVGREVEPEALGGVDETVLGEPPEVPVPPHEAPQHAVLQLLEPP